MLLRPRPLLLRAPLRHALRPALPHRLCNSRRGRSGMASTATASSAAAAAATTTSVRLALLQTLAGEDKAANIASMRESIADAVQTHAPQIVMLPECWNSPYATDCFPVYAEPVPEVPASVSDSPATADGDADWDEEKSPSTCMLRTAATEHGVYIIGGSIPERDADGRVFNTCPVFGPDGTLRAKFRKMHLFDIDVPGKISFHESETLTAGDDVATVDTEYGRIGIGICYDVRFPQLALLMRQRGCRILCYPGAFNTTTGPLHWELLIRARAVDNQVFFAMCSPARNPESKYQAWGHSTVVSPWGEVIATTEHGPDTVVADLDLSQVDEFRSNIPCTSQTRHDLYEVRELRGSSNEEQKTG